jgi:hypothetical protein
MNYHYDGKKSDADNDDDDDDYDNDKSNVDNHPYYQGDELGQRFSNCGLRTTRGPRVLPLWSS